MIIDESVAKNYEVPDTGNFNATIIDVVELKQVQTAFGPQDQVRVVWVLDKNDSEGKPFRVVSQVNAKVSRAAGKESKLYKLAEGVFGGEPALPFNTESLMGRSNELVIVKGVSKKTNKPFGEVRVIMPLKPGAVVPQAPQGFVRDRNKPGRQQTAPAAQQQPAPTQSAVATQTAPASASVQAAPAQPLASAPQVDVKF